MANIDLNRPNVIFILSDDQGPWATGYSGNSEILTPHIDRLADSGIRFDRFFCTSPVCSPARASLITGTIPSRHGVHDWISKGNFISPDRPAAEQPLVEHLAGQLGFTDYLADAGYVCGISGKWHLGDSLHPQKSFRFWEVHGSGGGKYYAAPMIRDGECYLETHYVTDVITDNALRFLNDAESSSDPFYLSIHYTAPHSPWERKHHPKEIFDRYFNDCPFESVPAGVNPPKWAQHLSIPVNDTETRRINLSGYFTAVEEMDRNIGRVLDHLDESGLRENTVVVFSSDNGMNMGHHGVYGKGNATLPLNMFEESVRVPFLVSRPGHVPEGNACSNLYSQYDFMPTILDYLGVSNPCAESLPGKSLADVLRGEESDGHENVVVYDEYGPVRMIRTEDWKYIHRYPYGPNELFDLKNDPGEETNLVEEIAQAQRVREMRGQLTEWFNRYSDPDKDGSRLSVTGSGQIGLCQGPADGLSSFSLKNLERTNR